MSSVTILLLLALTTLILHKSKATNSSECECIRGKLDCSHRSLISLSEIISRTPECSGITIVDVSHNHLNTLDFPRDVLQRNANVTLYAGNNFLTTLEGLEGWTGRSINVEYNHLSIINVSYFGSQLQHLNIANNQLTSIDTSTVDHLQFLDANNNSLTEFVTPRNCSLVFVDLSNNNLSSLSENIARCSWLLIFRISNNFLVELPEGILQMLKLRPTQLPMDDSTPQLTVDLRGNPMTAQRVKATIRHYEVREGTLISEPAESCECVVLRTADRVFLPVNLCVSSMCVHNRQQLWVD